MKNSKHKRTQMAHAGYDKDTYLRAINPPIVRASTITHEDTEHQLNHDADNPTGQPLTYGIQGVEPMRSMVSAIKELEHANHAFIVASGLLAITVPILSVVKTGAHILALDNIYSPGRRFFENYLQPYMNVTVDYFSPNATLEEVESMVQDNTVLMLLETPGSQTFEMADLHGLYKVCKRHNIVSVVDNSWASGYYYNPLDVGADISIMAATKYIGGGSDLLMGTVACNDDTLAEQIETYIWSVGLFTSPDDIALALRGLRTLPVRMDAQYQTTLTVTDWLSQQPEVKQVLYPPLKSDPYHDRWKDTFTGGASLFGILFDLPFDKARQFVDALELFKIGYSWGGFDSLAVVMQTDENRAVDKWDHKGAMVRIHIGMDHVDDVLQDLNQALTKLRS